MREPRRRMKCDQTAKINFEGIAIALGELDPAHLQNYRKLKKESEFHKMSHLEKRKKDRNFGKLVRTVIKAKGSQNEY